MKERVYKLLESLYECIYPGVFWGYGWSSYRTELCSSVATGNLVGSAMCPIYAQCKSDENGGQFHN